MFCQKIVFALLDLEYFVEIVEDGDQNVEVDVSTRSFKRCGWQVGM